MQEEEERSWLSDVFETIADSTEFTLSVAASTIREGVSDTLQSVTSNLTDTEFYKNNLAYIPPEDSKPQLHSPKLKQLIKEDVLNEIESIPIEDRVRASGQSIGFLNVRIVEARKLTVDGTRAAGTTHPYAKIKLGPYQSWSSPVVKEDTTFPGNFQFNKEISLVAQDINTDLVVKIYQKNVFVADTQIGQILIPLTSIIPNVRDALSGKHKRCEPYVLKSWFELFPLKEGRSKFRPAVHDIAETGMWKTTPGLGYLYLELELHLHGRISMWAGYAMPTSAQLMDLPPPKIPTGDLKGVSAVVETGRGFKRNFQRVKTSFARLLSRGDYVWYPMRFLNKARNVEDVRATGFVLCAATFGCLIAPPFMLPLNLFIVLLVSAVSSKFDKSDKEEKKEYIIWNQDVHDPDDELGSIQKLAKVVYLLEKFEKWMGMAADAMERMVHVFSFADERVTIAALLTIGVSSLVLSFVLFFVTPGYVFYLVFIIWFIKPHFGRTFSSKKKSITSNVVVDDGGLRAEGRIAQGLAVIKLIAQGPSFARNVFARVPTEDELGHRWISKKQQVPEPTKEDDQTLFIPPVQNEIWLREM